MVITKNIEASWKYHCWKAISALGIGFFFKPQSPLPRLVDLMAVLEGVVVQGEAYLLEDVRPVLGEECVKIPKCHSINFNFTFMIFFKRIRIPMYPTIQKGID